MEEQNNNYNQKPYIKNDGINPPENCGALWAKMGTKGKYFLGKITVSGVNFTFVCFDNKNKPEEFGKEPSFYIFPFKEKPRFDNQ